MQRKPPTAPAMYEADADAMRAVIRTFDAIAATANIDREAWLAHDRYHASAWRDHAGMQRRAAQARVIGIDIAAPHITVLHRGGIAATFKRGGQIAVEA